MGYVVTGKGTRAYVNTKKEAKYVKKKIGGVKIRKTKSKYMAQYWTKAKKKRR